MNWPPSRLRAEWGKAGRDAFSVPEGFEPSVGGVDAPEDHPSVAPRSKATAARAPSTKFYVHTIPVRPYSKCMAVPIGADGAAPGCTLPGR